MAAKSFYAQFPTGNTIYGIIKKLSNGHLLDDADGAFAAAPADPYVAFTEDAVLKSSYALSESRAVWSDGSYQCTMYRQAWGSPAPVSDLLIGVQNMYVVSDAEVIAEASSISASDVVTAMEDTGTKLTEVHAKLPSRDYLAGSENADGSVVVTVPSVGDIDTQLSSTHGAGLWTSASGGSGANEVSVLVETSSHVPIASAYVQVLNSDQTLLVSSGSTNTSGECTFALDDGSYKVRISKVGYTFTVPETLTVSGDTNDTYEGTAVSTDAPGAGGVCRVYDYLYQQDGTTHPAIIVAKAKIVSLPYDYSGKLHNGLLVSGTYSASTGLVYWDLAYGCKVHFTVDDFLDLSNDNTALIPEQASIRLVDLIGRE